MVQFVLLVIIAGLLPVRSGAQSTAPTSQYPAEEPGEGVFAIDAGGRLIRALETGSTLHVGTNDV
jgi:hypothetical protein